MTLHPDASALLAAIAESNSPTWAELGPVESRNTFNGFVNMFGDPPEIHSVENTCDANEVPLRIYRPSSSKPLPAVMYFHGGGWVLGNLDTHDTLCRRLAQDSGQIVIAVDYRLAPEHPYPAAIDDCESATNFVFENHQQLGILGDAISVAGDSAGGNLAAAVALRLRDAQQHQLRSQVLIYPVIEDDFETDSYRDYATDHMLTRDGMRWFWDQYLGAVDSASSVDAKFARVMQNDLSNLPQSLVITAEYDVLRTEGQKYAEALSDAGNDVQYRMFDGMLHAFVHFSAVLPTGLEALKEIAAFLQQSIETP